MVEFCYIGPALEFTLRDRFGLIQRLRFYELDIDYLDCITEHRHLLETPIDQAGAEENCSKKSRGQHTGSTNHLLARLGTPYSESKVDQLI
jgi:Holliday junction DNA helicase RuvB